MHKILITSLSVHWTVVFGLASVDAVDLSASPYASAGLVEAALATAHALVAMLFLWTAIAAWARPAGEAGGSLDDVARLALAAGALVLASVALLGGLAGEALPLGATAMQLAGLAATYLVIRAEEAAAEREPPVVDYSNAVARRLAVGAAHGSMLSRLARRSPETAGKDG